jgi:hypothetical protein
MTSGMHQCDPTPNVLVASTETAILQAIAMWGGTEVVTSTGAKHVFEAFQVLKFKAIYELGLATPQYYYVYSPAELTVCHRRSKWYGCYQSGPTPARKA